MSRRIVGLFLTCILISFASLQLFAEVPGPINISPNGRHFVDHDGKPFLGLGDTAWPLFSADCSLLETPGITTGFISLSSADLLS